MAGRKTLVDRVTEQIVALPADRFITPDLTDALTDNSGRPIATNTEVSGILKYYGLARNTGIKIRQGRKYYIVWERSALPHAHSAGKGNEFRDGGIKV